MKYKIRPLFERFQRELLAFANTNYGRDFLSNFGGKELKEKYPIIKVAPDGIHQQVDKNLYRAVFYPRGPYTKLLSEVLTMIDIANFNKYRASIEDSHLVIPHFMGETRLLENKLPRIYLASPLTVYPDVDPESTSVDGSTRYNAASTWAEAYGAGTGKFAYTALTNTWSAEADYSGSAYEIIRSVFLFDTSSIGSGNTVTNSVFSVMRGAVGLADTDSVSVVLVTSNPASNTDIVTADYDQFGDISGGSFTYASTSVNTYSDITMSDTSWVAKTGITKLGNRNSRDVNNTAPTGYNYYDIYYADNGSNKPKLVVTYSASAVGGGIFQTPNKFFGS